MVGYGILEWAQLYLLKRMKENDYVSNIIYVLLGYKVELWNIAGAAGTMK